MAYVENLKNMKLGQVQRAQRIAERKQRSDKKHRFTFRTHVEVWEKINMLNLLSGGKSLNLIMNMLVQYALNDPVIMGKVHRELPRVEGLITVRDWKV